MTISILLQKSENLENLKFSDFKRKLRVQSILKPKKMNEKDRDLNFWGHMVKLQSPLHTIQLYTYFRTQCLFSLTQSTRSLKNHQSAQV